MFDKRQFKANTDFNNSEKTLIQKMQEFLMYKLTVEYFINNKQLTFVFLTQSYQSLAYCNINKSTIKSYCKKKITLSLY